jgi:hypothetical protein
MACEEIHQNDIGTQFKITLNDCDTAVDLSAATVKQIRFTKPSGTVLTMTASFYTDGTDGIITYTSVAGDLDELGTWKIQAYVEVNGGKYSSSLQSFKVNRNLI